MKDNEGKVQGGEVQFIKRIIREYKEKFLEQIDLVTF